MSQVTIGTGAVWGIVGAMAMMAVMKASGTDNTPPFVVFWSTFIGDGDPSNAMPQALSLHALYGLAAGGVYAWIFNSFNLGSPIIGYTGGIIWGIVWGVVLMIIAAAVWINGVLDMNPDRSQVLTMGVAHVAYGLVLGLLGAALPHLI